MKACPKNALIFMQHLEDKDSQSPVRIIGLLMVLREVASMWEHISDYPHCRDIGGERVK